MRVLQLLSCPGVGGTESFVIDLAVHLRNADVDVSVANLWWDGMMARPARAQDVPYLELGPPHRPRAIAKLWHLVRSQRYDLVCAYGLRASLALRTLALLPRHPVLITGLRGLDDWRRPAHVLADRLTARPVSCFICNSDAVANRRQRRERTAPDKLAVIPNGIDTTRFSRQAEPWPSRTAMGLPEDGLLVTTVANMRSVKGHAYLLDIMSRLPVDGPGATFVWIGTLDGWPQLRVEAERLGLIDRIVAVGPVGDVRPYLACSDVFILPSREEGMPRALMEAMAMEVACIATAVGGTPEVIRDDIDGRLIPYGDAAVATTVLKEVLADPGHRMVYAARGRERISSRFSMRAIAGRHAALFQRLIDARDTGASA
jgi:glycosyltransferase involved in cell wall biosynthesis